MKPYADAVAVARGQQVRNPGGAMQITLSLLRGFAYKLAEVGRREFDHALARRRMNRVRRDTAGVVTRLQSATSILIVCHGNIIRSAFARRLVAEALGGTATVSIMSAGLEAVSGGPAHSIAILAAGRRGVDLTTHVSARIATDLVASADVIFVMDIYQVVEMRRRFPRDAARTFLLTCLWPEGPLEVRDPYDGDESVFEACFDDITRAVRPIVRIISEARRPGTRELA